MLKSLLFSILRKTNIIFLHAPYLNKNLLNFGEFLLLNIKCHGKGYCLSKYANHLCHDFYLFIYLFCAFLLSVKRVELETCDTLQVSGRFYEVMS